MTKSIPEMIAARKARKAAYNKRRTFSNGVSDLFVTKTRRAVRLTVVVHTEQLDGAPPSPGFAFVDLDDEQIDRLVQRLLAIRGGRRVSHTSRGNRRTP